MANTCFYFSCLQKSKARLEMANFIHTKVYPSYTFHVFFFKCLQIRLEEEKLEIMNGGGGGDADHSPTKKSRIVSNPVDLDLKWVLGKMPRKVVETSWFERSYN